MCCLQAIVHVVDTVLLPTKASLNAGAPAPAPAGMIMAPTAAKPAAMAPMSRLG